MISSSIKQLCEKSGDEWLFCLPFTTLTDVKGSLYDLFSCEGDSGSLTGALRLRVEARLCRKVC